LITNEKKVVRVFKKKGGPKVTLFCGRPKYRSHPTWGLRHIYKSHKGQWEDMAVGTFQGWREIADIGIAGALRDPDVCGKIRNGKHCYSRVVYLWDVRRYRIIGT
jgi:hypothetical protein